MIPTSEQDVADLVGAARGALRVSGGGTRDYGRPVVGEVLSLAGLTGISLYDPGALTLVARAGTPVAEVDAALAQENQRLAFEPMDHRGLLGTRGNPTIGGVAAANVSGPRRVQVGAARDHMLGVRFVDGAGRIVQNGGRVMKNVTGYDLVKLLAGSHGTLGVLTEVSLKVLPVPETELTVTVAARDAARAVAAMAAALGSPFEVSGAATGPLDRATGGCSAFLRIEGFGASVRYRAEQLRALVGQFGEVELMQEGSASLWRGLRDVEVFQDRPFVARLSIKPTDLPEYRAAIAREFPCDLALDWGGGLVWIAARPDDLSVAAGRTSAESDFGPESRGAASLIQFLQGLASQAGGHATLIKAPEGMRGRVPSFQPQAAGVAALSAGLRARFDPRGILNPGLMD